jgi:uncharacterized protein (TIGR01777 family)
MRIVIPGGTGQVGTLLARAFHRDGHAVVVLGRHATKTPWRFAQWDGRTLGPWARELDDADVVINLAGRSVNCRYSEANRCEILDSRVESTTVVGQAIAACQRPARTWLQASTATIYAHRFDAANDENTGIIGGNEAGAPDTWRFSIAVAKAWEDAAVRNTPAGTRLVLLRSAMIMSPDQGGIFATLLGLVRLGLGGPAGSGKQFVSWIHEADFVRAIYWLIDHEDLAGAVNVSSPNPLPYAHFMRALQRAAHVPFGLPAARWMIEIGTRVMRTESELVLKSRRVVPRRLTDSGFTFEFPTWPPAAAELVERFGMKKSS